MSDPQEAVARFSRVMDLVAPAQDDRNRPGLKQSAGTLLEVWAGEYRECLFYRTLTGVPPPHVTALLKDYMQRRQLPHPFDETEFLDVFCRAGDRELAEWIFRKVAESPPIKVSYEYLDDIPIGRPVHISEVQKLKRKAKTRNDSYRYLEPIYPYLGEESIPLLLKHIDSDNEQLRAFVVWRLTSLGYEWISEQLGTLLKDDNWKVRLNALFACDADELKTALDDENGIVRVIALTLNQTQKNKNNMQ